MPTISVIVPVYKTEPYLRRCVDSILHQSYSDFEIVLVDDGSPDNCPAICDKYADEFDFVYVLHQENTGQAVARNRALDWICQNSDAQWLMFVDSDDWIHPRMLEYLYRMTQAQDTLLAVCGYQTVWEYSTDFPDVPFMPQIFETGDFFMADNINAVIPVGKLYHRSLFEHLRYPNVRACEDEYLTYKILFQFDKFPYLSAPLYYYFQSDESTMRKPWTHTRLAAIDALRERTAFFKEKGLERLYHWSVVQYIAVINRCLERIKENPDYRAAYYETYRGLLQTEIRQHKKELGISIIKDPDIYRMLYPGLSGLVEMGYALGHRVKVFLGLSDP